MFSLMLIISRYEYIINNAKKYFCYENNFGVKVVKIVNILQGKLILFF
jgi:hypothetical protein